jgi:integrase
MSNKRVRISEGVYKRVDSKGILTYYISYTDNSKKLRWERVGKKNDGITPQFCKQLRSKRINQKMHGEDVSSQRRKEIVLFDDIAQDYFEVVRTSYKDIRGPVQRYEDHIKPHIGNKNINDITKWDVEYIIKLLLSKGLKPASVERVRQTISAIFSLGVYHEKCKENPSSISRNDQISIMRRNKKNINNERERYLTKEEAEILLKELEIRDANVYLMTLIALTTGARANEILSIKFKDIDFYSGYITLPDTKNGYSRKIKMTPQVRVMLQKRYENRPNKYLLQTSVNTKYTKIPNIYFVVTNKLFNKDLASNDSKNRVVFHTLRHTFASWLALDGVPIFTIQKLMGHRDIKMTMRYAKLSQDAGNDAVLKIEQGLLSG